MEHMEIERKFKPGLLLPDLTSFPYHTIEQGYLCTSPVVRIRREDEEFILTYKGKGKMMREEYNLPLSREAYFHLLPKVDGYLVRKKRYRVPLENGLTAEVDLFDGELSGLVIIEVEFPDPETARSFSPPSWFGEDVTEDRRYHNSYLSKTGRVPE